MHREITRTGIVRNYVWVDKKGVMTTMVERIAEETEVCCDSSSANAQESQSEQVSHEAQAEQKRLLTWFKRGLNGLRWLGELLLKSIISVMLTMLIAFFIG